MIARGAHRWMVEEAAEYFGFLLVDLHPERFGDWNGLSWRFRIRAATRGAAMTSLPQGRHKKPLDALCVHGYRAFIGRLKTVAPDVRLVTVWGTYKTPKEIGAQYGRSCVCEAGARTVPVA